MDRTLRTAQLKDLEQALVLYRELAGPDKIASPDIAVQHWQRMLAHSGTSVYCAESAGQIVSLVTLHILPNITNGGRPYALIENVVTLETEQGKGHGRALMEHVIDQAWQTDCYKIMLLTGQVVGARGFYERLGFNADDKFGMSLRRVPPRS